MPRRPPRYLRFARALALLAAGAGAGATTSGCRALGDALGCEHCYCAPAGVSVSQPVSCDVVGNTSCCTTVEGPLPPPDLPA